MRRRVACIALAASALFASCTQRLYEGLPRSPERVAVLHVGSAIVRGIDGKPRRGGAFDAAAFELTPGTHRLTLVFELPARSIGLKTIPAQAGVGTCELVIATQAGKQYYLGARPLGEPMSNRWSGQWEAWARDPSSVDEDDIIARCSAQLPAGEPTPRGWIAAATPTRAPVAAAAEPAPVQAEPATAPPPAAPPPAVVAPAAPAAPAPVAAASPTAGETVEFVRLGTWNLRSLDGAPLRDVARMAQAIEQHFDIITLTGIVATPTGPAGYQRLLAELGDGWRGLITESAMPGGSADAKEYYAIVYRRDRVRPCPGWNQLRIAGAADAFLRPPAFGCFQAGDLASPGVDFLLAAYRATWADGYAGAVALEVAHTKEVFAAMQAAQPGEADLIIAGDFNLEPAELKTVVAAADHTAGDGSRLDLLGNRTTSLTDHVLVNDDGTTDEVLGNAEALDIRGIAPSQDAYYRTISDHLPIMVRLLATGPDDD